MNLNFFKIIDRATKAVPSTKYAVGILGLVAIIALVKQFNINLMIAFWGTIVLLGLMILLLIFARLSETSSEEFKYPVRILMWSFVLLFVFNCILLSSAAFLGWPKLHDIYPHAEDAITTVAKNKDEVTLRNSITPVKPPKQVSPNLSSIVKLKINDSLTADRKVMSISRSLKNTTKLHSVGNSPGRADAIPGKIAVLPKESPPSDVLIKITRITGLDNIGEKFRSAGFRVRMINDDAQAAPQDSLSFQVMWVGSKVPSGDIARVIRLAHQYMPWIQYIFIYTNNTSFENQILLGVHNSFISQYGLKKLTARDFDILSNSSLDLSTMQSLINLYQE